MRRRKSLRSPRLERKQREKAITKALTLTVFSVVVIATALYAFSRPDFRIDTIEVSGSASVPDADVKAAVTKQLLGSYAGFIPKAHTLLYPKEAIKENLVRRFPAFSGVAVSLRTLSALRIAVRERQPVARACMDGVCYFLDETGFAFAIAGNGTEGLYYTLDGISTTTPLGKVVIGTDRLTSLLSFLKQLDGLGFDPHGATFIGADELEILSGAMRLLLREGEYDSALIRLQTLLTEEGLVPRKGDDLSVSYIDLRYGNKIYFK